MMMRARPSQGIVAVEGRPRREVEHAIDCVSRFIYAMADEIQQRIGIFYMGHDGGWHGARCRAQSSNVDISPASGPPAMVSMSRRPARITRGKGARSEVAMRRTAGS